MLEGLPRAGFGRIAPPDGAFYIYADVSEMTDDSRELCAADPARGGGGGDARASTSTRARGARHAALLLCRRDGGHRRGPAPARRLAPALTAGPAQEPPIARDHQPRRFGPLGSGASVS